MSSEHKVIIVGGGFGGVKCALELARRNPTNTKIVLISDKPHFEYHAALYRVVTGRSPMEICVPLREIFENTSVEVNIDPVVKIDLANKKVCSATDCTYAYDTLVLALGSETIYFNTPGLKELSFGFKSIHEALKLKRHLHEVIGSCAVEGTDTICAAHLVVVGGGPSGTELAADLVVYAKDIAKNHGIDPSLITVDLIQSPSRLCPMLPKDVSAKIETHLRSLGVNVYLNRRLVKEELEKVYLKDMEMKTKTVIWTAGAKPHYLYQETEGLPLNDKGQVKVNKYLQAKGHKDVYAIGDGAETPFSGMAQTALYDGMCTGENVFHAIEHQPQKVYEPKEPVYAIPVGPDWAAVVMGKQKVYGRAGWWLRRWLDFEVFKSILPFEKAMTAFREGEVLSETCDVCANI